MYIIVFTKQAAKMAKSLPTSNKLKLREIIDNLKISPFNYPYKKIKGEFNIFRIRIGKFRILYEVNKIDNIIRIYKIEIRSKAYK